MNIYIKMNSFGLFINDGLFIKIYHNLGGLGFTAYENYYPGEGRYNNLHMWSIKGVSSMLHLAHQSKGFKVPGARD